MYLAYQCCVLQSFAASLRSLPSAAIFLGSLPSASSEPSPSGRPLGLAFVPGHLLEQKILTVGILGGISPEVFGAMGMSGVFQGSLLKSEIDGPSDTEYAERSGQSSSERRSRIQPHRALRQFSPLIHPKETVWPRTGEPRPNSSLSTISTKQHYPRAIFTSRTAFRHFATHGMDNLLGE
jgi:hypothetical protein